MTEGAKVKVAIGLPEDAPTPDETLWAERLGEHLYRLDNTPWYARDCALDDLVWREETDGELPRFVKVIRPSGNRTVRVFVPSSENRAQVKHLVFSLCEQCGCIFEEMRATGGLIAITVPASADAEIFFEKLKTMEQEQIVAWESGNF